MGNRGGLHTVDSDIAHGISPVFLILRLSVILAQLPGKMPQDSVALRQDLAVQFDHGDRGRGVHLLDPRLLVLRVFLEAIADIFVGDAGVFPKQAHDLAAAPGGKIKIMNHGNTPYGFIGFARRAKFLCSGHCEGYLGLIWGGMSVCSIVLVGSQR